MDKTDSIDELIGKISIDSINDDNSKDFKCIALWVPNDAYEKYMNVQSKTKRKFTKVIRELFIRAVDQVEKAS